MLEIIYMDISELTPYENNAKRHPKRQIEQIKKSIEEFGMNDPIAICGENNTIVEGHGRLLACKELGINQVPVIRLDWLTDEQRNAYTLIHNKLTMNSDFNLELLNVELGNIVNIDMEQFDFNLNLNWDEQHEDNKETERFRDDNILNLEKGHFPGVGKYDIPVLEPEQVGDVTEWIGFNQVLSEKHPRGKGVHFFLNDYQFERLWNHPEKYVERLAEFEVVATPDFSPYSDMPLALQIFNHYRKHWVGAYLQNNGVKVIPTLRASEDPRSLEWWLDGEPQGGAVIISSMWTDENSDNELYTQMLDRLNPSKVFIYGRKEIELPGNTVFIKSFTSRNGWS